MTRRFPQTHLERRLGVNLPDFAGSPSRSMAGGMPALSPPRPAGFRFLGLHGHEWRRLFCSLTIATLLVLLFSIRQ